MSLGDLERDFSVPHTGRYANMDEIMRCLPYGEWLLGRSMKEKSSNLESSGGLTIQGRVLA